MQYGEYEIVRYTTTYQDSLLELLALLWGADTQNKMAYFKEKYQHERTIEVNCPAATGSGLAGGWDEPAQLAKL